MLARFDSAWATSSADTRPESKRSLVSWSVFSWASTLAFAIRSRSCDGPNVDVGEGGLRVERHQHVAVGFYRGLGRRVRGLHLAADATEDIDLPGGSETRSEEIVRLETVLRREIAEGSVVARLRAVGVSAETHLRFLGAGNDATEGARLLDPPQRLAQIEVAARPIASRARSSFSSSKTVHQVWRVASPSLEAFDGRRVPCVGSLRFPVRRNPGRPCNRSTQSMQATAINTEQSLMFHHSLLSSRRRLRPVAVLQASSCRRSSRIKLCTTK